MSGETKNGPLLPGGSVTGKPPTGRHAGAAAAALALLSLVLLVAAACASPEADPTATPAPAPGAPDELVLAIGSSDIAVGPNRLVFAILDVTAGPVRLEEAAAGFYYLDSTPAELRFEVTAEFVRWPAGSAGVYVANVSFDEAGRWGVVVAVPDRDGTPMVAQAGIVVEPESASPAIGAPAPASVNRTAGDVSDLSEITTATDPDPDLYRMTIADAVASGRPTLVTFATPAFCTTATCGPQVDVVSSLKDRYGDRANFIHVEVYDNPNEVEGDLSRARLSPLMAEWGLRTEPFTFVLDRDGVVVSKYEGFATGEEIEAGLAAALER